MNEEAFSSTQETNEEAVLLPKKKGFLKKLGAGSLAISVIFHAILVAVGVFIVIANIPPEKEKEVDFRARGGGGGSPASSASQRKMQVSMSKQMPMNRVAAAGVANSFVLPEPSNSGALSALGAMGGGTGGLGGPGSGGGSGAGIGTGTGNGMGMGVGAPGGKGLMVFGTALPDVRSIGVVMDVSGSMTRHLPRVLSELDRVAKGSPVILHVGCGIGSNKTRPRIDSVSSPMRGNGEKNFKGFWSFYQDPYYRNNNITDRGKVDLSRSIPSPEVYESFAKRSGTYFNDPDGPKSTADALLAREFDKVDAIYWFADFQDKIDEKAAEDVLRTLKRRKQKLYIHASQKGDFFDVARNLISLPSGGKEIDAK